MPTTKKRRNMGIIIGLLLAVAIAAIIIVNQPAFGRLPQGERLERIRLSPNYRDGQFHNQEPTPMMTGDKSRIRIMLEFLFRKDAGLRPEKAVPAVRTDLQTLPPDSNLIVWFGHSSYLIQADRRRILVDPVFCKAAPFEFLNKPFKGADIYSPADMPAVDYLVITHDHWDHLDYHTVTQIKARVDTVICPLGVGEHFEYWGFDKSRIIELDWQERAALGDGFSITCLPSRHFSGRGPRSNRALWGSFLWQTPSLTIYLGGDGGYGKHVARIGQAFPSIDLAILENGQYNESWKYIHTMPDLLPRVAKELGVDQIMTVHHSKYALAKHPWDEPLQTETAIIRDRNLSVLRPQIGEVIQLKSKTTTSPAAPPHPDSSPHQTPGLASPAN